MRGGDRLESYKSLYWNTLRCFKRQRWGTKFLEAGKKRLVGDTTREATSTDVVDLRPEHAHLKPLGAETVLDNRLLKKV